MGGREREGYSGEDQNVSVKTINLLVVFALHVYRIVQQYALSNVMLLR